MFEEHCLPMLQKYNLCKPPVFTTGHFTIGIAVVLGSLFVFTHIITIAITSIVTGWGGFGPLSMDLSGFFAGLGFVFVCRTSSNTDSVENYENNKWVSDGLVKIEKKRREIGRQMLRRLGDLQKATVKEMRRIAINYLDIPVHKMDKQGLIFTLQPFQKPTKRS